MTKHFSTSPGAIARYLGHPGPMKPIPQAPINPRYNPGDTRPHRAVAGDTKAKQEAFAGKAEIVLGLITAQMLTTPELVAMTGYTRQTVAYALDQLQRQGKAEKKGGSLRMYVWGAKG